jgi:MYXO-CTERM domain-containing protein
MSLRRPVSLILLVLLLAPAGAQAITRDEVMARARAFAQHPWRCTTANLTASCSSSYASVYLPGDYVGLPYDWGGYMTLFEFDQQIAQGHGAGSYDSDGILDCTAGLDCSGYVSQCWDTWHHGTTMLPSSCTTIAQSALLPGDAMNQAGYHVLLYSHSLASGEPVFYEAAGYNVHVNLYGGWSNVSGYTPLRYNQIQGTTAGDPPGTMTNPIVINALPYSASGDTSQSVSDVLDGCAAAPATGEAGPEVIYKVTLTQPGNLTVSVSDGVGVDIDVHLYTSMNTGDCIARHDQTLTQPVDCGNYYIVADTYSSGSQEYPGPYTLTVSFTPSGSSCGAGPPTYNPKGGLGDACVYPGPYCNPNLGAWACLLVTSTTGFCSRPCKTAADCTEFAGGCCQATQSGDYYCHLAQYCGGPSPDLGPPKPDGQLPAGDAKPATDGPTTSSDGSTKADGPVGDGAASATDATSTGDSNGNGGPDPDSEEGGCSCALHRAPARTPAAGWLLLAGLLLLGVFRRR